MKSLLPDPIKLDAGCRMSDASASGSSFSACPRRAIGLPALIAGLAFTLALGTGCSSSKDQLKAERQKAYLAGQEQAWQQYQQAHPNSIRFDGPVTHPVIEWRAGLTLVHAIVQAGYGAPGNPGTIVVLRGTEQRRFTARQLLNGEDLELQPGDQIVLRP